MPRPAKPHWHKTRRRWFATIGEPDESGRRREVFAPEEIGPRSDGQAWEWMRAEQARRERADEPVAGPALTVADLAQLYLAWADGRREDGKLSDGHYSNKTFHLRRFADEYGRRKAETITPREMETFIGGLQREGLSPTYVHNLVATIAAVFNWAAGKGKILPRNPLEADGGFERPRVPRGAEQYAERSEAAVWIWHFWRRSKPGSVAERYDRLTTLMQRIMIRTGARPGELVGLRWEDLRWGGWKTSAGHLGAKAMIPPDRWKSGDKTGEWRTLYIPPVLTRALRREFDRPDRHPVAVFTKGRGRGGKGAGEPWPNSSILSKKILRVRRELIEIQEDIRGRVKTGADATKPERWLASVTIKDDGSNRMDNYRWRHTAISSLLMRGEDVATVAGLTGTSVAMIEKTYGHLLDKHLQGAAERLAGGRR